MPQLPVAAPAFASAPSTPAGALAKGPGVVGLAIAIFGWVLVATSLFGLNWVDGQTFVDLGDKIPSSLDGAPLADVVALRYVDFLGLVLFVLVAVALVIVAITLARQDPTGPRVGAGLVVLVAVVLHAFAVSRLFRGDASAEVGAYVGIVGYLVVIGGLAIGSNRRRPA